MSSAQDTPRSDLASLVVRGVGWIMASQATVQLLAFITSLAVARLLGPRQIGLAAMALVFSSLALILLDAGLPSAVIQRPNLSERDKSTAFWAGMALGLALTLVGLGLSWPLAHLYGEPEVQPLFAALSLAFLLTAPGMIQGALLHRELRFRSLEVRTMIATALSSAVAVTLAAVGVGAWAIIAQHLAITGISTALLWRASEWRPSFQFSLDSLRGMARYAAHVFGSQFVSWATVNVDKLLVGRFLGAASLGAYSLAFSIIITPVTRLAEPITEVFFPAFSRMRDPARVALAWLRGARMVALPVIPGMLGLIVVAPDLVRVLFGERWEEAIPVIQILATVGLLQAVTALDWSVLQAVDRAQTAFRFALAEAVVSVGAFAAGLPWGVTGVATAYLLATVLMTPVLVRLTAGAVGISVLDWGRALARVTLAAAGMFVAVLAARAALISADVATTPQLLLTVATGCITYSALVWWWAPDVRDELRSLWDRVRGRAAEASEP